jgi:hypothetical protein
MKEWIHTHSTKTSIIRMTTMDSNIRQLIHKTIYREKIVIVTSMDTKELIVKITQYTKPTITMLNSRMLMTIKLIRISISNKDIAMN